MTLMGKRQIIASSVGRAVELPAVALRCLRAGVSVSVGSCRLCSGLSCMGMWFLLLRTMQKRTYGSSSVYDGSSGWSRTVQLLSRFIEYRECSHNARLNAGPAWEPTLTVC